MSKSANELVEHSTGAEVGQIYISSRVPERKKLSSRFGPSQISRPADALDFFQYDPSANNVPNMMGSAD
jgi:hypothetical protein